LLTDVKNVGQVNDEGVPLDNEISTRWSRVCGLPVWQRVSLTLERFDDLVENGKDELFKNFIQAYVEYLEELKQKGNKVAMKIISHAWRTYMRWLMKCLRDKKNPFNTYKDLTQEYWERFLTKCESGDFVVSNQYMQWLRSQNELDHYLGNIGYARKQRQQQQEDERLA
jgi:hypothetical protein